MILGHQQKVGLWPPYRYKGFLNWFLSAYISCSDRYNCTFSQFFGTFLTLQDTVIKPKPDYEALNTKLVFHIFIFDSGNFGSKLLLRIPSQNFALVIPGQNFKTRIVAHSQNLQLEMIFWLADEWTHS